MNRSNLYFNNSSSMILQNNFQCIFNFWLGIVYKNDSRYIVEKDISSDETIICKSTFFVKQITRKNFRNVLISNLCINYFPSKFDQEKLLINTTIDVLVLTETELGDSSPSSFILNATQWHTN